MQYIVDLHLHSHYSRATSPDINLEGIYRWGKMKGINIIGTGDFTHPMYFAELKEKLVPTEPGLFKLRDDIAKGIDKELPASVRDNTFRYLLSSEISTIYSKNGKVRKLHNLILLPDLDSVSRFNSILGKIGNLKSDGRPILGLDSKELLKITLGIDPMSQFIPAHIWTPWFSMFGSRSGFDSISEAFEELSEHIRVIETGLSSDPFMNWRIKELDGITIVSNSDAHSGRKLGREANIMDIDLDYNDLLGALRSNDKRMIGTIEFFPEEGRYHYDGHRACNVVMSPIESRKLNGLCPKCNKPLVIGVDNRVNELADKDRGHEYVPNKHKVVEYIIPLTEILAELNNTKSSIGKKVTAQYMELLGKLGDEFSILRKLPIKEIEQAGYMELSIAIGKMRNKDVFVKPGYDGVYGIIKVFPPSDKGFNKGSQMGLIE